MWEEDEKEEESEVLDWRRRHGKDKRQCLEMENQTKRNPRHIKRTLQNVDQMLVGRETRADTEHIRRTKTRRKGGKGVKGSVSGEGGGGGRGTTQRQ